MAYGIAGYAIDGLRHKIIEKNDECSEAYRRIIALQDMLNEVLEYMDQRADADHDGEHFVANEEMRLMMAIEAVMS